tara:strand:- start:1187 stop:1858 length:672 start_codon:yes stop_codon:yes gene_type:complete
MIWQDQGFLLSIYRYNENSAITEFFTLNHGKITGVIFGATSKKIKNYLLIGNNFHLNYNSKNDGKIGYFKIEINKINTPIFLDNQKKLFCIIFALNLIKILTVDNQSNKNIYNSINDLFSLISVNDWLVNFIFWELNLYKNIGYDINFKNYVKNINLDGKDKFVVESTNKIIPNFLINNEKNPVYKDILDGFKIVGDFLDKTILKPNNINYPLSRNEFIKLLK